MGLAADLWRENGALASRTLEHLFVRGLGDGSLPLDAFRRYVAQDAWFLEGFARAYAFALAHAPDRETLAEFAALLAGVTEELRLHRSYADRWGSDLSDVRPTPAAQAYVDFLLEHARSGDVASTCAAMTPCMRLYAFLGASLAQGQVAPAYAEWVATYASADFEALAARLESLLDRLAADTPAIRAAYRRAMELELGFFEAML